MKKYTIILALIGFILFGCGGGGGGSSDSGTNDNVQQTVNQYEYMTFDESKTYTYREIEDFSNGEEQTSSFTDTYTQVNTIPGKYNYSNTIHGPYTLESINYDNGTIILSYSASGYDIISDDSNTFIDIDHTTSTGGLPTEMAYNTEYPYSIEQDLFNSNSDNGPIGQNIGTKSTSGSLKAIKKENITVAAGTFSALKVQFSYTTTYSMNNGVTQSIASSGFRWYGAGVGIVKSVASNTLVMSGGSNDGTITSDVTDELTSLE